MWCNSRALKPSYAGLPPLYLESIGHHWSLCDAAFYLKGVREDFEACTDHYALVSLSNKALPDIPEKLKDLFMDLRGYSYNMTFVPGARNVISDALCRSVKWGPKKKEKKEHGEEKKEEKEEEEEEEEEEEQGTLGIIEKAFVRKVTARGNSLSYIWKHPLFEQIIKEAGRDQDYIKVAELVKERKEASYLRRTLNKEHPARLYLNKWNELGTEVCPQTGITLMILDHTRVVIPEGRKEDGLSGSLRRDICKRLHTSHMGESKSVRAAEHIYYWPFMSEQVRATVRNCEQC